MTGMRFQNGGTHGLRIPAAYREGYAQARALNPALADEYIRHTVLDDPAADAAVEALAPLGREKMARFIAAGMDGDAGVFSQAPPELQAFFAEIEERPAWYHDVALDGRRVFHEYSDLFVPAFFVVTLMNAASLVSKAFYATGRVMTTGGGIRRIRQNTRHFVEIMLPGSLDRHGDGWKHSVRIRLIHAQVRRLIRASGEWDESVFGAPLSLAHMALSSANFSASMIRHAMRLGVPMDAAARESFMQTWRYASLLIGSPEALLFEGDEERTHELSRISSVCEPLPEKEAAAIADALVRALPIVAGKRTPRERRAMIAYASRVSRALLGAELSNRMGLPRYRTEGVLAFMQARRWTVDASRRLSRQFGAKSRVKNVAFLFETSVLGDMSYYMPDRLKASEQSPW